MPRGKGKHTRSGAPSRFRPRKGEISTKGIPGGTSRFRPREGEISTKGTPHSRIKTAEPTDQTGGRLSSPDPP
jgi:hypothetical protein